jgi:predicted nucleotidyltransferase
MKSRLYQLDHEERRQRVERLRAILEKQDSIAFAYLYGSFAENFPFHDIDVGVYAEGIGEKEATFYSIRLSEMMSSELGLPVDVRVLNFAPVTFLYHVFRGNLIHEKNELIRSQVMERTVQKYLDLRPILYRGMKEAFTS